MIKQYIKPFIIQEPATALQYAYLIALGADGSEGGEKQKEVCLEVVRDIVLASRSWSKLLGSVKADGSKEVGIFLFFGGFANKPMTYILVIAASEIGIVRELTGNVDRTD